VTPDNFGWPDRVWAVHPDVRRIVAAAAAQVVAADRLGGALLVIAGEALVGFRWAARLPDTPRPAIGSTWEQHLVGMAATDDLLDRIGWEAGVAGLLRWAGAALDRGAP